MKRPLAAIGFTYLAVSAAAVCLFPEVNFILCFMAAITAIAACFLFREKMRNILLILCPVCIALLVIGCCQLRANDISDNLSNQSCVISGEICEIPRRMYGRWRYTIETDSIDIPGVNQKIRILMTSGSAIEEAEEGDRITCEVQFLQSNTEPGYASTTSLRADGINARCWCKPYSEHYVTHGGFRLKYIHLKIKRIIISFIRQALTDRASAMLCGMLLGDTDFIDSRTVENFRATGIAHLLAVSGLHMTLLAFTIQKLLNKLRVRPKPSIIIVVCFILSFMSVTGFTPSVVRAGVMHIAAKFSNLVLRDEDSLTSLSLAILLMCIVNPWAAADIGLQLSVCSTLGLLLASDRINESLLTSARKILIRVGKMPENGKVKRSGKRALSSVSVSLAASLSVLPLTAIHFGSISLISPLTNLLCLYIASIFIITGIIASMIYCIPFIGWLLSLPLRFAAAALCTYLEAVAGILAKLPFSVLNTSFSYMPYLMLFIALLLGCAFIMNRRIHSRQFAIRLRSFVLCEITVLIFSAMASQQIFCKGAEIMVFDTSDGGMCVCAKNRTHAVFAEAGGNSYGLTVIKETLRTKGVMKVDAIAVSDDSKSRSSNLHRMLNQYSPDFLITDIDLYTESHAEVMPFKSTVKIDSMALTLETFTDRSGGRWQRMTCGGTTALICPEKGNCTLIPENWRSCDAAVVGKDIIGISTLNVGAVIISANEINSDSLRSRLQDMRFRHIYSTSYDGCITISVKNGKLRVQTAS